MRSSRTSVGHIQPVAALRLDRGRAERAHLGDAATGARAQLRVAGSARRGDRCRDAAAGVGLAGHARGELGRAVAREDEVRVAVDEARDDAATRRVDARVGRGRASGCADPRDASVVDDERGVVKHSERRSVAQRRFACHELGDVGDERGGHWPAPAPSPSRIGIRTPRSSATSTARS